MAGHWDKLSYQVDGIAGFIGLYGQIKIAVKEQRNALSHLNPAQSTLNEIITNKVEATFDTFIKPSAQYAIFKKKIYAQLFPSTQAILNKTGYIERKASQLEHILYRFKSQPQMVYYLQLGVITLLSGFGLTFITLNPVKLYIIAGIFFSIVGNHSAISTLLQDFQRCARLGQNLLKKPLEARAAIRKIGERVIKVTYPQLEEAKEPHAYHLAYLMRLGLEKTIGEQEEFENMVDKACRLIRNFEQKQRFEFLSYLTDVAVKNFSVLISTQVFRFYLTNLTSLGIIAIVYWLTYYHLDTPFDQCEWYSPLTYTWNGVFPFNSLYQFPELCHRYLYLTYFSHITTWTLRFYIWNRMIKNWETNRATAIDDLMRPIKEWSHSQWSNISSIFITTTAHISDSVRNIFNSIGTKFSGKTERDKRILPRKMTHLPLNYLINVEEVQSISLT